MAQQGTKSLEQESVSSFEKFKDLTKRLFRVDKEELQGALKQKKGVREKTTVCDDEK